MKVKDVDLKIFSRTPFYSGSGYRIRYGLTDKTSKVQTSQKFIIDIPAIGFIAKGSEIENFYIWNGKGYDTFKDYNEFKKELVNEG